MLRYLLQNGARPSINQARNSALACVLRHVTDWEFRYDLLNMLLQVRQSCSRYFWGFFNGFSLLNVKKKFNFQTKLCHFSWSLVQIFQVLIFLGSVKKICDWNLYEFIGILKNLYEFIRISMISYKLIWIHMNQLEFLWINTNS